MPPYIPPKPVDDRSSYKGFGDFSRSSEPPEKHSEASSNSCGSVPRRDSNPPASLLTRTGTKSIPPLERVGDITGGGPNLQAGLSTKAGPRVMPSQDVRNYAAPPKVAPPLQGASDYAVASKPFQQLKDTAFFTGPPSSKSFQDFRNTATFSVPPTASYAQATGSRFRSKAISIARNQPSRSSSKPTLLTLPDPIRKRIFGLVVIHKSFIRVPPYFITDEAWPPLLRVNRAIRKEVLPIFYSENTFLIMFDGGACQITLKKWLKQLGPQVHRVHRVIFMRWDTAFKVHVDLLNVKDTLWMMSIKPAPADWEKTVKKAIIGVVGKRHGSRMLLIELIYDKLVELGHLLHSQNIAEREGEEK